MPKARRQKIATVETTTGGDAESWPVWLPQRMLSIEDVALIFDVHPRSVRRWIADGRLPCVHVGGVVRLRPETALKLINGQKP